MKRRRPEGPPRFICRLLPILYFIAVAMAALLAVLLLYLLWGIWEKIEHDLKPAAQGRACEARHHALRRAMPPSARLKRDAFLIS